MNQSKEELAIMVNILSQEVARLTADKAMLMAKLELATAQLNQSQGQE